MKVADLELCKELYELSGWGGETMAFNWYKEAEDDDFVLLKHDESPFYHSDRYYPAYDLGYLLRKLPPKIKQHGGRYAPRLVWVDESKWWLAQYYEEKGLNPIYSQVAETPEDAACKLAIELFKQGILTKEAPYEKCKSI